MFDTCSNVPVKTEITLLTAWNSLIQITHFGIFYSILDDFDDEDLRFNDYENRLEDSFFKYVARTDDYDRNEVPWESHEPRKPVQVKMSAYLRYESNIFLSFLCRNFFDHKILRKILRIFGNLKTAQNQSLG